MFLQQSKRMGVHTQGSGLKVGGTEVPCEIPSTVLVSDVRCVGLHCAE